MGDSDSCLPAKHSSDRLCKIRFMVILLRDSGGRRQHVIIKVEQRRHSIILLFRGQRESMAQKISFQ